MSEHTCEYKIPCLYVALQSFLTCVEFFSSVLVCFSGRSAAFAGALSVKCGVFEIPHSCLTFIKLCQQSAILLVKGHSTAAPQCASFHAFRRFAARLICILQNREWVYVQQAVYVVNATEQKNPRSMAGICFMIMGRTFFSAACMSVTVAIGTLSCLLGYFSSVLC